MSCLLLHSLKLWLIKLQTILLPLLRKPFQQHLRFKSPQTIIQNPVVSTQTPDKTTAKQNNQTVIASDEIIRQNTYQS